MDAEVAVIGAGPAGLSAARALCEAGVGSVLVLERERSAGGIPRHAAHTGFGVRDLHRLLSGPDYARALAHAATEAGAQLRCETAVTGVEPDGALSITCPEGRSTLRARAVVLATGCRERPRSARLVPGDRPAGVMSTGTLQQMVVLERRPPGRRALLVGAEHVSFSALATLAHAGARAVAMVTEQPRHQSLAAFRLGAALRYRVPLYTRTRLQAIRGSERVEAVELADLDTGAVRVLACDLVVFTADWVPEYELPGLAGLALDPGTRGPRVDGAGRTARVGWFAAGNLLHGAETAEVAALGGRAVAGPVAHFLAGETWPDTVPVAVEAPLHWVVPNLIGPDPPEGLRLRALSALRDARVRVLQGERELAAVRLVRVGPGRSARLPGQWAGAVDPAGGPVSLRVS